MDLDMFSSINLWLGAVAGAALIGSLAWVYNSVIDNPSVEREALNRARLQTLNAINEVSDVAQRARAMRRFCRDSGKLYDFGSGKCS